MNKLVIICFIVLALAGTVIFFKLPVNKFLPYGIILLCPLMHVFMMKSMWNKKEKKDKGDRCH